MPLSVRSRVFAGLPPHSAGQKIGLYGGSFNPAHRGHRQVSLFALKRLGLHQVWWLVSPGNPLKDVTGLPSQHERMVKAAAIAAHPRIVITGAEAALRTRYTADFIRIVRQRAASARFVWLMGSDNLLQFHRWEDWRAIADFVPLAVINRPGSLTAAMAARAAQALWRYRVDEADALMLATREPPAWTFLTGPRTAASSTALRRVKDMS
jgi:nicotinate-nucleotide adenylyltransferase